MSHQTFDKVVALLERDPVFQSKGKKPQRPVKFQLVCFLIRYGSRGADTLEPVQKLLLGHGTVFIYCRRVTYALHCLRLRYVRWPEAELRAEISEAVEELAAIPGVIRIANIQATVDHLRCFTSYEIGHGGSVPDVTIFKQSHMWMHRPAYFELGQFILADKGYPCSPYTLRPFAENELRQRIEVEHAFGDLKGRFQALKCFGGTDNMPELFRAVEALIILHNICIEFGDQAADIPGFTVDDIYPSGGEGNEDEDIEESQEIMACVGIANGTRNRPGETDKSMKRRGKALRLDILDIVVPP
ncbi:hypothetical protein M407DRAFT_23157 [Tulasnella calospora MUT 4182]|uniref:DDE Tnp4 domain-containing protein n=1 Tax=Tulasnella calospora MUT 4182 TaxID=1051891 RepID=A0A0C3L1J4_9AGAM|nr:hypothetical protein M407DRAFT_23157 [Tulasnella calospora MUT 4182]